MYIPTKCKGRHNDILYCAVDDVDYTMKSH